MSDHVAGKYKSTDGRQRWGVLNMKTLQWTFPDKTDWRTAHRTAKELNKTTAK